MNSPLAKSFLRLNPADKDYLQGKFNIMYYLLKKERLFTDYPDLLNLQMKNRISKLGVGYWTPDVSAYFTDYIGKVIYKTSNYFPVLSDSSSIDLAGWKTSWFYDASGVKVVHCLNH